MNLRSIRGLALLINAIIGAVIGFINLADIVTIENDLLLIVSAVLALLFIFGLPAIWQLQPQTGRPGQVGLWCLGIASGIAFVVHLAFLASAHEMNLLIPWSSALLFLIGSVLVGWLTIQARVFPAAPGWLLMLGGVLNLVGGLSLDGSAATIVGITSLLAQTAAIAGYGWIVVSRTPSARAQIEAPPRSVSIR